MWATAIAYIAFFLSEHILFQTIQLNNGLWFQLLCHAVTLGWSAYFYMFKPYRAWSQDAETESLLKHGLPLPKMGRRKVKGK
jgi:hypothetical protein